MDYQVILIILPAAYLDAANAAVAVRGYQPWFGDAAFSPSGLAPATHYYASVSVPADQVATIQGFAAAMPGSLAVLSDGDPLQPAALLQTHGLVQIPPPGSLT